MADIDIAELRKLLAEATPGPWHMHEGDLVNKAHEDIYWAEDDCPNAELVVAAVNALPGLLDENDRLVSRLALSGRSLEESHQSITEYEQRIAVLEAENHEIHGHLYDAAEACSKAAERIAELEAALREIVEVDDYYSMRIARAALEGKEPAE